MTSTSHYATPILLFIIAAIGITGMYLSSGGADEVAVFDMNGGLSGAVVAGPTDDDFTLDNPIPDSCQGNLYTPSNGRYWWQGTKGGNFIANWGGTPDGGDSRILCHRGKFFSTAGTFSGNAYGAPNCLQKGAFYAINGKWKRGRKDASGSGCVSAQSTQADPTSAAPTLQVTGVGRQITLRLQMPAVDRNRYDPRLYIVIPSSNDPSTISSNCPWAPNFMWSPAQSFARATGTENCRIPFYLLSGGNEVVTFTSASTQPSASFRAQAQFIDKQNGNKIVSTPWTDVQGYSFSMTSLSLPRAIAQYKLEGNARDEIGAHNGVLSGTPNPTTGKSGQGYRFDSGDDAVRIPYPFNTAQSYTVEAFFKADSLGGGYHQVFDSWAGGFLTPVRMLIDGNQFGCTIETPNTIYVTPKSALSTGIWYHGACAYNAATKTLATYLDGRLLGTKIIGGASSSSTSALGHNPSGGEQFYGSIDEVKIFDRTLTNEEVLSDCKAGGGCGAAATPAVTSVSGNKIVDGFEILTTCNSVCFSMKCRCPDKCKAGAMYNFENTLNAMLDHSAKFVQDCDLQAHQSY